jgi:hypothetical protein
MRRAWCAVGIALVALGLWSDVGAAGAVEWRFDRLDSIAGHHVEIVGAPRVVDSDRGKVVEFDGAHDGLIVDANPLEGLSRFTIEVLLQPDPSGQEEQRFVHIQEAGSENRAMIELRMLNRRWALDTYLRHADVGLTLLDREKTHPAGEWHLVSLIYDGKIMTSAVDGRKELMGDVSFVALKAGRTAIGVRHNLVSHFRGRIHSLRVT